MENFLTELKLAFTKSGNGLMKLILINIIVFVAANLVYVPSKIFNFPEGIIFIQNLLYLPPTYAGFITHPWTLITTFFTHMDPFHILFNMLFLYYFGSLISEYLGSKRLISLYIYGGITGAILYLLCYNHIQYFAEMSPHIIGLIGASGCVYAIVTAAATLLPDYTFFLLFFGPVKIKWIALFYIFLSFINTAGSNAGGNLAHLGGALLGFVFIRALKNGNDLGKPVYAITEWLENLTKPNKLKVTYTSKNKSRHSEVIPNEREIDDILDKISKSGYDSLTKEEKNKLFRASQKS
jgi:membrane associated rhomboid family serine protease